MTLGKTIMTLMRDMKSTFHLRVFRKHLGMYLCGFGAEWLFASVFTYFIIFVLQYDPTMVAGLSSLSSILQLFSTAIFIAICVKHGFSKPYILALGIVVFSVVCYSMLHFFNLPQQYATAAMLAITVVFGIGTGGVYYIPWTVYTFLADIDEAFTGRRREGIYAGAMTFSGKMVRSVIVFVMGAILSVYGFQSKSHTQPESAVTAIAVVFCVGVVALALMAMVFSAQMKLNRKTHLVVLGEVARIKAGGQIAQVEPDVRAVMEELIGYPYEECWGNSKVCRKIFDTPTVEVTEPNPSLGTTQHP
jgi:oligogalacturonide transporter